MNKRHNPLRLNVGFIIHETPGYTRDFKFDFPHLELSSDLPIKDFKGTATFSRTQRGILVEATLSGALPSECVRCLDPILNTIATNFTELYAFNKRTETELELRVPEEGYIDLAPIVREYILLDMATNPLCNPKCAGLCPLCGVNLNKKRCDCKPDDFDPRLAKLKDLLDKDE